MHLKILLLLILFLQFSLSGRAQNFSNKFYVTHLNPNPLKRVSPLPHSIKLIGVLSEFPLSYYPVRDSNGTVIRKEGVSPLIFWWTADRFKIEAELMERTIAIPFDPNITLPVSYYEMLNGPINLNLGFFVMTPRRNRLVDFTHPFFMEPLTLIIPDPVLDGDIWSAWKAFKPMIWLCLFASLLAMSGTFVVFNWHYSLRSPSPKKKSQLYFKNSSIYITQVLLNQGGECSSKSLAVRILAGIWCLMACVLVNTYSSTMTAHLLVSYPKPIIHSVYQLPEQNDVKLIVKKGSGTDFLFSTADKGIYKQLGEMLQSHSSSRCTTDHECLAMVRTGTYAYANPEFAAFDAMIKEYQLTKKCEFTTIREHSLAISMAFFTLKDSPIRETVNRGVLEMKNYGLVDDWIEKNRPRLKQCPKTDPRYWKPSNKNQQQNPTSILSLKHMAGAFVVLGFGMALSFCALIGELMTERYKRLFTRDRKICMGINDSE